MSDRRSLCVRACSILKFLLAGSLILQMAMLSHAQKPGSGPGPATDTTGTGTCAADGSDYTYVETVSGTTRTVVTNHCPNHVWTTMNPNYPIAGDTTYNMPSQVRAPLKTAGRSATRTPCSVVRQETGSVRAGVSHGSRSFSQGEKSPPWFFPKICIFGKRVSASLSASVTLACSSRRPCRCVL